MLDCLRALALIVFVGALLLLGVAFLLPVTAATLRGPAFGAAVGAFVVQALLPIPPARSRRGMRGFILGRRRR